MDREYSEDPADLDDTVTIARFVDHYGGHTCCCGCWVLLFLTLGTTAIAMISQAAR